MPLEIHDQQNILSLQVVLSNLLISFSKTKPKRKNILFDQLCQVEFFKYYHTEAQALCT